MAPDLYFESFVLSESIAAGCDSDGIYIYNAMSGLGYFNSDLNCSSIDSNYEMYCYTAGAHQLLTS